MKGYVKMVGIVDMKYTYCKENHLFKDDYLYISYKEPLKCETDEEDDWLDDMIRILQKISKPEYRELAKKQIELITVIDM